MPFQDPPKRDDYKTRKEYRFAHKKVTRNNSKQPEIVFPTIIFFSIYIFSHNIIWSFILSIIALIAVIYDKKNKNVGSPKT